MVNDFPFLARLEILPEWEAAARRWLEVGGAALVLGAPDAGKSTLSRYLVYRAYAAGLPVGLVDLDLGQSHLGPPASLGLGLFPPLVPGDDSLCPQGLYFIGQTSPLGAILEVAVGCRVLADQGSRCGVNRLAVNTSGFVQGPGALRLKQAQAELLQPGLILALQQDRELEPLLWGLSGGSRAVREPPLQNAAWEILRLPVSERVRRRDPEQRRLYREGRFRRYFGKAREMRLALDSFAWQGLAPDQGEALQSLLVGLLDGRHRTLALGLILPAPRDRENLALLTPLAPEAAPLVHFVKLGKLRLNQEGEELPHV